MFRKGYKGLTALVERELGHDVQAGDMYLFVNRRRQAARVLMWDGTGMCLYSKRLSRHHRFPKLWRQGLSRGALQLTAAELNLFLDGVVEGRRARKR